MSGFLFSAINTPDDGAYWMADTRGKLHKLDLVSASEVSKIAPMDDRISDWWSSSISGGSVNLAASQTVSRVTGLPDSMTVTKARKTPSWKAALLAIWRKTSIFLFTSIGKLPLPQSWRESARMRKTVLIARASAEDPQQ